MTIFRNSCPFCGYETDRVTDPLAPGAFPMQGDASICWRCAEVSAFDDKLNLRKPTPAEKAEFDKSQDVIDAIACLKKVKQA